MRHQGQSDAAAGQERPTVADIENGVLVENERFEFKRQLDLGTEKGRSGIIDDVVAFLNRGPATIVIGVEEHGGAFKTFRPMSEDRDFLSRQLLSVLQNGISPVPLDIRLHYLDVEGGYLLDIEIPRHRRGPFQNRHTGAFLIRTHAQNRPIPQDELRGYFVDDRIWLDAAINNTREETSALERSGRMTQRGPVMYFGIVPKAYFDPLYPQFRQDGAWRHSAPTLSDLGTIIFKGRDGGHEAFVAGGDGRGSYRLLVRDDWFIHGWAAWPIWVTKGEGRVTLHEFKTETLPAFLADIDRFLAEQDIEGPYAVMMEMAHLDREADVAFFFPDTENIRMVRPRFVDLIADIGPQFFELVHRASRYA